jgi:plasmid stabilization system protein ParE
MNASKGSSTGKLCANTATSLNSDTASRGFGLKPSNGIGRKVECHRDGDVVALTRARPSRSGPRGASAIGVSANRGWNEAIPERGSHGATVDLDGATAWYEAQPPGLGNRLFAAVGVAVASVVRRPNSGRPVDGASIAAVREVPNSGFPYRIYRSDAKTITILAIAHERRSPKYWSNRPTT